MTIGHKLSCTMTLSTALAWNPAGEEDRGHFRLETTPLGTLKQPSLRTWSQTSRNLSRRIGKDKHDAAWKCQRVRRLRRGGEEEGTVAQWLWAHSLGTRGSEFKDSLGY